MGMSPGVFEAMRETRGFLFERVYLGRLTAGTREAVQKILQTLLDHFERNPHANSVPTTESDDPRVGAVDYVAGMTDRFAIRMFEELIGGAFPGFGLLG